MTRNQLIAIFVVAFAANAVQAQAPDSTRGRLLYERSCALCHTTSVHGRSPREARDLIDVRGYVVRWSRVTEAGWSPSDIEDVVSYLNERFYKYPSRGGDQRSTLSHPLPNSTSTGK
jgi:mono/diheme cytochrome c family protein